MRHKIGILFIVLLMVLVCATAFTACNGGKYQMQDFIVDFEEFAKTYEVGDQVDLSKIKMSATFSDGTTEAIPLDKVTIKVDGVQISLNELSKITETTGTKIIEIKYSNVVRNVTIKVNEKHVAVLTGVEFDDTNLRKQYDVNDAVSFEGLVVKAVYDGYDKRAVALTDTNIAIFMGDENITSNISKITETVGEKTIKIRYMTILSTDFITITVNDVLEGVTVSVPQSLKTEYKVNDTVSFDGISASASYRNGRKVKDLEVKYYLGADEITDFDSLTTTAGTKVVKAKATYDNMIGEQTITLEVVNSVESLNIVTEGVDLDYIVGDTISITNFAGVVVNVIYVDTSANKQVSLTTDGVECVNNNDQAITFANLTNTAGTKTINVKYGGKTSSFSVVVAEQDSVLQSLSVTSQPTVTSYTAGATGVSFDGLVITGVYKDGTTPNDVIPYSEFATKNVTLYYNDTIITNLDDLTKQTPIGANQVVIGINYLNKTTSFTLTVTNNVTELQILTNPTILEYLLDEPFSYKGLSVKAIKNFGEDVLTMDQIAFYVGADNVTANLNAITATAGTKAVKIKYAGQEISFNVTVTDYIVDIELEGVISFETNVNKAIDSVFKDFSGLKVYTLYKSGNRPLLNSDEYTISGNGITSCGTKVLTITHIASGEKNKDAVLIVKDILNSIEVDETTIPTKIVKNGEVERFLINLRVVGTYEYRGVENINILQSNGESFLYGVVHFELKVADEYQALNQLSINDISNESGNREIKITYSYNGKNCSDEFVINILAHGSGVDEFSLPQSLLKYNEALERGRNNPNENDSGFEGALFVGEEEDYLVGDDNPYRFVPTLNQIDLATQTINQLASFAAVSKIYLVDGENATLLESRQTGTYTLVWSNGGTDYVTETTNENKYQFSAGAIGKKFKLSVLPDPNEFSYSPSLKAVEWTVKVVDGYNIYDSREICLLEQPSAETRAEGRTYWDSIKTELGLTGVRPSSILLHDSLVVTKDSLPQAFWFTLDDSYEVYYNYNHGDTKYRPEDVPSEYGGPLERSFIWDEEWGLLRYDMNKGETFAIHGNFFDIDLSKLPLICAFDPKINYPEGRDAYYMDYMSKTTFIDIRGWDVRYVNGRNTSDGNRKRYLSEIGSPTEDDEHDEHFIFENFAVKGNCSPKELLVDKSTVMKAGTDNPVYGGGIIFVKTHYCHSEIRNINAHSCFISFFTRDYTVADYINLKSYDTYLNAVYALGETTVNMTNCHFKRAGGPLMIVTQQTDNLDSNSNDDEYIEIPRLIISNDCVLENYVTGQEVWFDIFAPGQVDGLAALDGLLNGYFNKSMYCQTGTNAGKFNLICVSSQGQCYVEYKGDKLDRIKGNQEYPTTVYDITSIFNGKGAPAFTVGNTMCAVGQTEGGDYYLQNASQTPLQDEDGMTTIGEFAGQPHTYVSIHVGSGGDALGIFTGFYTKA